MADEEKKEMAPITRQERLRYNQYVKKMMATGGTPAPIKEWVQTQRGGK